MKAPTAVLVLLLASFSSSMAQIANGAADPTFNVGSGFDSTVKVLATQPGGKVIAGGNFSNYKGAPAPRITRLLPNGDQDPSFQPGSGPSSEVRFIFPLPDEKILIGGNFSTVDGVTQRLVARLHPDGTLDQSYVASLPASQLLAADLQADGKLVIGGTFSTVNGSPYRYLARLNADGTLDDSFGPFNSYLTAWPHALKVQPDEKILVSSSRYSKEGVQREYLFRLNSDGTLDESFDSHRVVFASTLLELLPDGSVVAEWMGMKRLFPNGRNDSIFAMPDPFPYEARVLPDGRILGQIEYKRPGVFYSDGTLQFEPAARFDSGIHATAPGPNGTIYVGGAFMTMNGLPHGGIARIFINDLSAPPVIEWNGTNFGVLEDSQRGTLPLLRLGDTNTAISVRVTTQPQEAGEADFAATELTVEFQPGETLKYVEVPLIDDELPEKDEAFQVTVAAIDGSFSDTATVTIISDEGIIEIGSPNETLHELSRSASITVQKLGAVPYSIVVQLSYKDGTIDPALDLRWQEGTQLVIAPGAASTTRIVPIIDDRLAEGDEFMVAELLEPEGTHIVGENTLYRLDLADNDRPGVSGEGFNFPPRILPKEDGGMLVFGDFSTIHGSPMRTSARLDRGGSLEGPFYGAFPSGGFSNPEPFGIVPLHSLASAQSFYQVIYTNRTTLSGLQRTGFLRLNNDGTRDTAYNTNLTFSYPIVFTSSENSRVVVAERTNVMLRTTYALRLIGSEGQVERSIVGRIYSRSGTGSQPVLVGQQSSGHVLIAGSVYGLANSVPAPNESMAFGKNLLRFNLDGTADPGFQGNVVAPPTWAVQALEVLPDDRILLAGNMTTVDGVARAPLARLLPNGALDAGFAPDFSFLGGTSFTIVKMLPQTDGSLLLRLKFADGREHLAQLNESGALNEDFPQRTFEPGVLHSVVQLADGRIAISGEFLTIDEQPRGRIAYLSSEGDLLHDQPVEILGFNTAEVILSLDVAARVGGNMAVQGSADLQSWVTLETFSLAPGDHHLEVSIADEVYQFFRIAVLE